MSKQSGRIVLLLLALLCMLPALSVADDEPSADRLYEQAVEQYNAGNKEKALSLLNQVIEQEPDKADAYYWRGWIHAYPFNTG